MKPLAGQLHAPRGLGLGFGLDPASAVSSAARGGSSGGLPLMPSASDGRLCSSASSSIFYSGPLASAPSLGHRRRRGSPRAGAGGGSPSASAIGGGRRGRGRAAAARDAPEPAFPPAPDGAADQGGLGFMS